MKRIEVIIAIFICLVISASCSQSNKNISEKAVAAFVKADPDLKKDTSDYILRRLIKNNSYNPYTLELYSPANQNQPAIIVATNSKGDPYTFTITEEKIDRDLKQCLKHLNSNKLLNHVLLREVFQNLLEYNESCNTPADIDKDPITGTYQGNYAITINYFKNGDFKINAVKIIPVD